MPGAAVKGVQMATKRSEYMEVSTRTCFQQDQQMLGVRNRVCDITTAQHLNRIMRVVRVPLARLG